MQEALRFHRSEAEPVSAPDFVKTARTLRRGADASRGLSLTIRGLWKSYGSNEVLRGIDLHVPAGQFVAIAGRSGCGKSTLLRLIAGLETIDAGSISFGQEVQPEDIRIMFQEPRLPLVSDPRVLAFDEPLGALDALTRISMQRLLERVWRDQAFTAILVTHDVSEAVALADRVLVIEDGQIADDIDIDHPRPRRRGSADLAALEGSILRELLRAGDERSDP